MFYWDRWSWKILIVWIYIEYQVHISFGIWISLGSFFLDYFLPRLLAPPLSLLSILSLPHSECTARPFRVTQWWCRSGVQPRIDRFNIEPFRRPDLKADKIILVSRLAISVIAKENLLVYIFLEWVSALLLSQEGVISLFHYHCPYILCEKQAREIDEMGDVGEGDIYESLVRCSF